MAKTRDGKRPKPVSFPVRMRSSTLACARWRASRNWIDPFPGGRLGVSYQRPIAHGEVRRIPNGTVVWLRTTGSQAASDPRVVTAPFDFIFVDGDHTFEGLQADWEAWARHASDIIALHDVIGAAEQGSVRFARERIFTDPRFAVLKTVGCLAVLKRR